MNENVLESDFKPLCVVTTRRCPLADLRLLERMHITHTHSLLGYVSVSKTGNSISSGGQSTQIKYLSKSTDTYNKILLQ